MIAGDLEVRMWMNVARIADDVNKATGAVGTGMKKIESSINAAKGVLASFGVALGAYGIITYAKDTLEFADSMGKAAQATGVSVEALSQMTVAAKLADVDMETMAKGLEHVSQAGAMSVSGTSTQARAFAGLGISVKDASGNLKDGNELMREMADKFATIEDGSGKTAAAMAIFGRAGAAMIPMLNKGSEELDRMAQLSDKLGLTISGRTAAAAEKVNDEFTTMGLAVKGLAVQFMDQMLPVLTGVSNSLLSAATNGGTLDNVLTGLVDSAKVFVTGFQTVDFVLESFGRAIGAVAAAGSAALHGDFGEASKILKMNQEDAKKSTEEFAASITKLWEDTSKAQAKAQEMQPKREKFNLDLGTGTTPKSDRNAAQNSLYAQEEKLLEEKLERDIQHQKDYEDAIAQIQIDAFNRKLEIQAKSNAELAQLAFQGELSLTDIQNMGIAQRVGTAASGLGQLFQMVSGHSKTMFELSKKFALIDATISMYQGIAKGVALGWPMGIPAVAWATAQGIATIQKIQASQFGGAGGGGVAAGGGAISNIYGDQTTPTIGAIATKPQTTAVTIHMTDGMYTAGAVRNLIEKINEQVGDGMQLAQIRVS